MVVHGASYCLSSKIHFEGTVPDQKTAQGFMNDPELNRRFSKKSLRLALAYNIADELQIFTKLEKSARAAKVPNPEFIRVESAIYRRIQLMTMDINAVTSEFGCYVDRFSEIIAQMKQLEDDIVSSNTLYAILSGAVFSFFDGLSVYNNRQDQIIIITGAMVVTYFSYKAFRPEVTIEFKPKSSNLKDIWFMPEKSSNFSTALWMIMTENLIEDDTPIRDRLITRWIENGFLGKEDKEDRDFHINLFFGTGGISDITHITNRREMNSEVKTMILLLSQDINSFLIEVVAGHIQNTE